jgi:predicted nucleotidyltransferase component of viral defense system
LANYDITFLGKKAKEMGFIRDTLEKVARLVDILDYFNTNPILKDNLALKGGTAINLTIFKLPRLSGDIDLDYIINNSKEEMFNSRKIINHTIEKFMGFEGYTLSSKSKETHSLDSFVFSYSGTSGNKDNIKIEINYSLRSHILEVEERTVITEHFSNDYKIKTLNIIEIYASKINAMLNRAAARDLYDVNNMIKCKIFDKTEQEIIKKCIIFYAAISDKNINKKFNSESIDLITKNNIKRELMPVLKTKDDFELEPAKKLVKEYMSELMVLSKKEKKFLNRFENGEYIPELLFEDEKIINRIKVHPMALWKLRKR